MWYKIWHYCKGDVDDVEDTVLLQSVCMAFVAAAADVVTTHKGLG